MTDPKPRCFVAMPVTTHAEEALAYDDEQHWAHVLETLFVPAIEAAGFEAVRPVVQGSHLIHAQIISNLSRCEMVLCDLSGHNPNVFFELGVRTSVDLPITLVRDENTTIPFDTSGINTYAYGSRLRSWSLGDEVEALRAHLVSSVESCGGRNPLWRQFGVSIKAAEPISDESPTDAKLDVLYDKITNLQMDVDRLQTGKTFVRSGTSEVLDGNQRSRDQHLSASQGAINRLADVGVDAAVRLVGDRTISVVTEAPMSLGLQEEIRADVKRYAIRTVFEVVDPKNASKDLITTPRSGRFRSAHGEA